MKKSSVLVCSLALALTSTPMFADTLFNFSFTGNSSVSGSPGTPFSGSGQFDAQATSTPGQFLITDVTGTTDGQTIVTLLDPGGFFENDNLLSGTTPGLDNSGVSYQLANGVFVNLFFGVPGQGQQELFGFPGSLVSESQTAPITITPVSASPVPEPGSIVLLGTGALSLLGLVRRRLSA